MTDENLVSTTKSYYDSKDADEFYYNIWGGEDIHVGIYEFPDETIFQASKRTIQQMVSMVKFIDNRTKILDIGAGYGGAARYLASKFRCSVTCLNLSERENERNRQKNKNVGLEDLIRVVDGNFEALPFEDAQFDIIWSQDAILHSGNKLKVFEEVHRVLKPNGQFILTDPMQSDHCPEGVLTHILERIHLQEMGSVKRYKEFAAQLGWQVVEIREMPEQLVKHYTAVQKELQQRKETLLEVCSPAYIDRMHTGLGHWISGGEQGNLNWGVLHFKKK